MIEHDHEPVRGLPGDLPPGEHIVWQAAPQWQAFARGALHRNGLACYFAVLAVLALVQGHLTAALAIVVAGTILQALLVLFAVLVARTTVYTLTNRRVVLRVGVALSKCINLPLALIGSADLRGGPGGCGDIALTLVGRHRLGYAMLWPHARPWRLGRPQPMLRALADAPALAQALARACAAAAPAEVAVRTAPVLAPGAGAAPAHGEVLHGAAA